MLPPGREAPALRNRLARLEGEAATVARQCDEQAALVRDLAPEVESLRPPAYLSGLLERRQAALNQERTRLYALDQQLSDLQETQAAEAARLARLEAGDFGPPRAHLSRAKLPQPPEQQSTRAAQIWAAVSGRLTGSSGSRPAPRSSAASRLLPVAGWSTISWRLPSPWRS